MKRRDLLIAASAVTITSSLSQHAIARSKDNGPAPFTPGKAKRLTKVVGQLQKISLEKRKILTQNSQNKTADELTNSLSEMEAVEVVNTNSDKKPGDTLRLIAWNTERGRYWKDSAKLIREHPALQNPDVVFLGEMDLGMARSWNKHTTRELAAELNMNYAYAVENLELSGGEEQERELYPGENEWGYHGNAILSKYPMLDIRAIRFPGSEFWYGHYQKRLGGRNAVLARINLNGTDITLASTHFESHDQGRIRQQQMQLLLDEIKHTAGDMPVLIGGDFNGIPTEPLFEDLKQAGFLLKEYNEMGKATTQDNVDGVISFREKQIDYITGRGVTPVHDETSPKTIAAVYPPVLEGQPLTGKYLGDHAVVTCKIKL